MSDRYTIAYLLAFFVALALSTSLTPVAMRLGEQWQIIAVPAGRRKHVRPVPKSGGMAIFAAFTLTVLLSLLLPASSWMPARLDPKEPTRLAGLLLGGIVIFAAGLIDDRLDLPPWAQLLAQVLAAGIAIASLIIIEYFNIPFAPGRLPPSGPFPWSMTVVLTLFWIVGMINTMNWLDGLDGLAGGVTVVACLVLFANAAFTVAARFGQPQASVALLPLALAGATAGFLLFNLRPATVFMGSSGSYFLGFALGCLAIIGGAKIAAVLLVMAVPILDVAWQIVARMRRGHSPFHGDRGHLYQRLVDRGIASRSIVLVYYLLAMTFGAAALLIDPQVYKFLALVLLILLTAVVYLLVPRSE